MSSCRKQPLSLVLVAVASLGALACGSGGSGAPDSGGGQPDGNSQAQLLSVAVSPPEHTFVVLNNTSVMQQYRLIGTFDDGTMSDVTDQAIWTTFDPALLNIDASGIATTSTQLGGQTIVRGAVGELSAQTGAIVIQRWQVVPASVPADAPTQFATAELDATPGRAPAIMYPTDGTVLPPNFPGLDLQFLKGQGNTLYELAIVEGYQEYREYAMCNSAGIPGGIGCSIVPDGAGWVAIGAKFSGKDVAVTVTGLSGTAPATKATSSPRTLRFIAEDLGAGLYYWAASAGSLYRFDFGHAGVPPELFYSAPGGAFCVGCHALSRDGSLAAIGIDSPSPSGLNVIDVATKALLWSGSYGSSTGSNYHAFSPDNTKLLTTDGYTLEVRDAMTGAVLPFGNVAQSSLFPDWSPDGGTILYTKIGATCTSSPCSTFTTSTGAIAIRPFDGMAFGAEELLVPYSGINSYYPAFTPDNAWVVFNRVTTADSMGQTDSYNNPYCKLWATGALAGGGNPIEMSAANGGYLGNTWPKVAPVMKQYADGSVTFITFTSTRPIGLKTGGVSQIWMAAFDPVRAAMGLDPSFPAVHLPWQDVASANHIAEWATDIPHDPCGPMGECPSGEFCEDGECVVLIP